MVEAAGGQRFQARAGEKHAGGDQVGVEARLRRGGNDLLQVAPHGGLAAGEVELQHAEAGRLAQHILPFRGSQLATGTLERQRVRAVGALQRTAVRQLGEQPYGGTLAG